MKTSIRYGDYLQALGAGRREDSLIALASPGGRDQWGLPMPRPAVAPPSWPIILPRRRPPWYEQ
jgi:hypothetical protein